MSNILGLREYHLWRQRERERDSLLNWGSSKAHIQAAAATQGRTTKLAACTRSAKAMLFFPGRGRSWAGKSRRSRTIFHGVIYWRQSYVIRTCSYRVSLYWLWIWRKSRLWWWWRRIGWCGICCLHVHMIGWRIWSRRWRRWWWWVQSYNQNQTQFTQTILLPPLSNPKNSYSVIGFGGFNCYRSVVFRLIRQCNASVLLIRPDPFWIWNSIGAKLTSAAMNCYPRICISHIKRTREQLIREQRSSW